MPNGKRSMSSRLRKLEAKVKTDAPEVRTKCSEYTRTPFNLSGLMVELTSMGATLREGNQCKLKRVNVNFVIDSNHNSLYSDFSARIMIVRSKIGPLSSGDFPTSTTGCPDRSKYVILEDRYVPLHANAHDGTVYAGYGSKRFTFTKRYKNLRLQWLTGGSSTQDNGIYMWIIGENASMHYEGYAEIDYTDA